MKKVMYFIIILFAFGIVSYCIDSIPKNNLMANDEFPPIIVTQSENPTSRT